MAHLHGATSPCPASQACVEVASPAEQLRLPRPTRSSSYLGDPDIHFPCACVTAQDAHVLALDEATANVDRTTDALIQKALRDFAHADTAKGRVLLVIAHRIDTIMDCDNLLLLSSGRLIESGNPQELAESPKSQFGGMVRAARLAVKAHQ